MKTRDKINMFFVGWNCLGALIYLADGRYGFALAAACLMIFSYLMVTK